MQMQTHLGLMMICCQIEMGAGMLWIEVGGWLAWTWTWIMHSELQLKCDSFQYMCIYRKLGTQIDCGHVVDVWHSTGDYY